MTRFVFLSNTIRRYRSDPNVWTGVCPDEFGTFTLIAPVVRGGFLLEKPRFVQFIAW